MLILNVFLALACIVLLGSLLPYFLPEIPLDTVRKGINKLVLYIFLPALNFNVIYKATIGYEFWQLPIVAFVGVFAALFSAAFLFYFIKEESPRTKGALIFGSAFSNVTYFGIAVLQGLFPNHLVDVLKVAILFEITITPLNVIVGSAIGSLYGKEPFSFKHSLVDALKMPLLWTTFIALFFNLMKIPVPSFVVNATTLLASAVSGLMILSLGIALKYPTLWRAFGRFHLFWPLLFVKLALLPFLSYFGLKWLGVAPPYFQAGVIEAAMPTQLISLAVADRFDLDIEMLAIAISVATVISFITLPLVHTVLLHFAP